MHGTNVKTLSFLFPLCYYSFNSRKTSHTQLFSLQKQCLLLQDPPNCSDLEGQHEAKVVLNIKERQFLHQIASSSPGSDFCARQKLNFSNTTYVNSCFQVLRSVWRGSVRV